MSHAASVKCKLNSKVSEACCASLRSSTPPPALIFLFRPLSRSFAPHPRGCELRILLSSPFGIARKITVWDRSPVRPFVRWPSDRSIDRSIYRPSRSGQRSGINLLSGRSGGAFWWGARWPDTPLWEHVMCKEPRLVVRLPDISGWHY